MSWFHFLFLVVTVILAIGAGSRAEVFGVRDKQFWFMLFLLALDILVLANWN